MSKKKIAPTVVNVISIILIIALSLVLLNNIVFIVKGAKSEGPPSILGVTPLVVLTGSMDGDQKDSFPTGSMIFLKEPEDLEVGDIIAYKDPASSKLSIVTHRIIEVITEEDGRVYYRTKGDANNAEDPNAIPSGMIIGQYFFHLPHMGDFSLFLQEPIGMLLFIGVPILLFIGYDGIRGKVSKKKKTDEQAELEAELARLRALAGEGEKPAQTGEGEKPAQTGEESGEEKAEEKAEDK